MHEDIMDAIRRVIQPTVEETGKLRKIWIEVDDVLWAKLDLVQKSIEGHEDKSWTIPEILIDSFEEKYNRVMSKAEDETMLEIIRKLADHVGIEMKAVTRDEFESCREENDD